MRVALVLLSLIVLSGCAKKQGAIATTQPVDDSAKTQAESRPIARVADDRTKAAIERGVRFLLDNQQPNGSWGTGLVTRGFEVYSMVPGTHHGLRVATTGLCAMALFDAGRPEAAWRGIDYIVKEGDKARRDSADLIYNIWAHTYGLQALAHAYKLKPTDEIKQAAMWHLDRLVRYETHIGGWNYYDFKIGAQRPAMDPTSFGTAAALVALHEARSAGFEVPQPLVDRALRRLSEMRLSNHAYLYSADGKYRPRADHNLPKGSVGRTASGDFALSLWKHPRINANLLQGGMDLFVKDHNYIQMGRQRQWPHESWYATAPYYYYFGHYYAARLIEHLNLPRDLAYVNTIRAGVLAYQEKDGSWWDYAMWDFHKPYGTAYAVMILLRCGPALDTR
jgi:hypothetical protein